MVAIKRLDENATVFDFNSELQLAGLRHTNLVRLLGWCVHGKERLLVYEFMHNGSLDRIIFGMFSQIPYQIKIRTAPISF
jgi:interleukin-1 receptor-associated kinase 1